MRKWARVYKVRAGNEPEVVAQFKSDTDALIWAWDEIDGLAKMDYTYTHAFIVKYTYHSGDEQVVLLTQSARDEKISEDDLI